MFDAIKTDNSFTSIPTIDTELTGKLLRRLHLDPLLLLLKKGVFNKNIIRTSQVVVACSLNEKSTEVSSSNEDSAEKSDEEDVRQELAEEEIQETVEDVQESLKGGVQEATKEALGDEAETLN